MASGKTTNMELNTFIESDVFDIQDFNENFNKIDAIGKDYIVDQNMTGYIDPATNFTWRYRKWNSGLIEYYVESVIIVLKDEDPDKDKRWDTEGSGPVTGIKRKRYQIDIPEALPANKANRLTLTNAVISTEPTSGVGVVGIYGIFETIPGPEAEQDKQKTVMVDLVTFTSHEGTFYGRYKTSMIGRWK